jgi:hypothetical protein
MTAIAVATARPMRSNYGVPLRGYYPIAASTKIVKGAIVALNSSGNAVNAAAGVTGPCVGVAAETVDNSSGSAGALSITVHHGVFEVALSGTSVPTIANAFQAVFAEDNNTVRASGAGSYPTLGTLIGIRGGVGLVMIAPWAIATGPGVIRVQESTLLFDDTDIAVAATSMTRDLAALPAGAHVIATGVELTTAGAGGAISNLILAAGTAADTDSLITTSSLFAAAVDGQASTKTPGVAIGSLFGGKQIRLTLTATGANLNALTQLNARFRALYTIPY